MTCYKASIRQPPAELPAARSPLGAILAAIAACLFLVGALLMIRRARKRVRQPLLGLLTEISAQVGRHPLLDLGPKRDAIPPAGQQLDGSYGQLTAGSSSHSSQEDRDRATSPEHALPATAPHIGTDELQLRERIGRGGSAEVYRGSWLGTPVAVKLLTSDDVSRRRLGREAKILMQLRHPHICSFFGARKRRF